jgi:Ca2+:H+ antiporter
LPKNIASLLKAFATLLVILGLFGPFLGVSEVFVFLLSGLAIIPLASIIAASTENISDRSGQVVGGLLNASFGNAPEMIVALIALSEGFDDLVKASIAGTIIANLLLALGLAMVAGGIRFREQTFAPKKARINTASLNLALVVMFAPAAIRLTSDQCDDAAIMGFSIIAAGLLLTFYLLTLVFSLKTHRGLYEMDGDDVDVFQEEDKNSPSKKWEVSRSVIILLLSSVLLCFVSENLVESLKTIIRDNGFSELFTGVFLIPLFGGAVEYLVAMKLARANKMDLSIAIATGSSLQISMFVAPVLVFAGLLFGKPMSFDFHPFELLAAGTAVALTNTISSNDSTNWLEGVLLIMVYAVIGVALYYHP